jgi:hypothetical protein
MLANNDNDSNSTSSTSSSLTSTSSSEKEVTCEKSHNVYNLPASENDTVMAEKMAKTIVEELVLKTKLTILKEKFNKSNYDAEEIKYFILENTDDVEFLATIFNEEEYLKLILNLPYIIVTEIKNRIIDSTDFIDLFKTSKILNLFANTLEIQCLISVFINSINEINDIENDTDNKEALKNLIRIMLDDKNYMETWADVDIDADGIYNLKEITWKNLLSICPTSFFKIATTNLMAYEYLEKIADDDKNCAIQLFEQSSDFLIMQGKANIFFNDYYIFRIIKNHNLYNNHSVKQFIDECSEENKNIKLIQTKLNEIKNIAYIKNIVYINDKNLNFIWAFLSFNSIYNLASFEIKISILEKIKITSHNQVFFDFINNSCQQFKEDLLKDEHGDQLGLADTEKLLNTLAEIHFSSIFQILNHNDVVAGTLARHLVDTAFSERFISQALNLFAKQNDYLLKLILENKAFENWLTTERLLDIYKNLKTTEIPTEIIASITKKIPNNYDDLLKFYHAQQGKLFKYKIIEQAHIFQFILDKHNEKREEQKATLLYLAGQTPEIALDIIYHHRKNRDNSTQLFITDNELYDLLIKQINLKIEEKKYSPLFYYGLEDKLVKYITNLQEIEKDSLEKLSEDFTNLLCKDVDLAVKYFLENSLPLADILLGVGIISSSNLTRIFDKHQEKADFVPVLKKILDNRNAASIFLNDYKFTSEDCIKFYSWTSNKEIKMLFSEKAFNDMGLGLQYLVDFQSDRKASKEISRLIKGDLLRITGPKHVYFKDLVIKEDAINENQSKLLRNLANTVEFSISIDNFYDSNMGLLAQVLFLIKNKTDILNKYRKNDKVKNYIKEIMQENIFTAYALWKEDYDKLFTNEENFAIAFAIYQDYRNRSESHNEIKKINEILTKKGCVFSSIIAIFHGKEIEKNELEAIVKFSSDDSNDIYLIPLLLNENILNKLQDKDIINILIGDKRRRKNACFLKEAIKIAAIKKRITDIISNNNTSKENIVAFLRNPYYGRCLSLDKALPIIKSLHAQLGEKRLREEFNKHYLSLEKYLALISVDFDELLKITELLNFIRKSDLIEATATIYYNRYMKHCVVDTLDTKPSVEILDSPVQDRAVLKLLSEISDKEFLDKLQPDVLSALLILSSRFESYSFSTFIKNIPLIANKLSTFLNSEYISLDEKLKYIFHKDYYLIFSLQDILKFFADNYKVLEQNIVKFKTHGGIDQYLSNYCQKNSQQDSENKAAINENSAILKKLGVSLFSLKTANTMLDLRSDYIKLHADSEQDTKEIYTFTKQLTGKFANNSQKYTVSLTLENWLLTDETLEAIKAIHPKKITIRGSLQNQKNLGEFIKWLKKLPIGQLPEIIFDSSKTDKNEMGDIPAAIAAIKDSHKSQNIGQKKASVSSNNNAEQDVELPSSVEQEFSTGINLDSLISNCIKEIERKSFKYNSYTYFSAGNGDLYDSCNPEKAALRNNVKLLLQAIANAIEKSSSSDMATILTSAIENSPAHKNNFSSALQYLANKKNFVQPNSSLALLVNTYRTKITAALSITTTSNNAHVTQQQQLK